MRRSLHAVLVSLLATGLTALPVAGQAEAVELRYRLTPGEALYYTVTVTLQSTSQMAGRRSAETGQSEARLAVRALGVDADGTMLVEVVLEDFRITTGGGTQEVFDPPWLFKVRPDGKVVERQAGNPEDDYPLPLPTGPVKVGDSWNRQTTLTEAGFSGQATNTITLTAVEQAAGERIARLRSRIQGRITGGNIGLLPPGFQSRISGTLQGNAEVQWSIERGRPLLMTEEATADVQIEVSGEGQTVRGSINVKVATRRVPIPLEQVPLSTVAPEWLIAPGKAIGPFTLELSLEEISSRLGTPSPATTEGDVRASLVRWPEGISGYVESADQTKLIGLLVSDRRYRTEKGIGFGSSMGAVMVAYGMSPARLEMTVPNVGAVRVLSYNELGVAFAIASGPAPIGTGPRRAPTGSVTWVTVFAPGSAGKIYPLP